MSAWIAVFDHPYFSVTGDDGTFDIKNLPDGDYTLQAWHEKYGTQEQKFSVKGGKAQVNVSFKADAGNNAGPKKLAQNETSRVMVATPAGIVGCPECAKTKANLIR